MPDKKTQYIFITLIQGDIVKADNIVLHSFISIYSLKSNTTDVHE